MAELHLRTLCTMCPAWGRVVRALLGEGWSPTRQSDDDSAALSESPPHIRTFAGESARKELFCLLEFTLRPASALGAALKTSRTRRDNTWL